MMPRRDFMSMYSSRSDFDRIWENFVEDQMELGRQLFPDSPLFEPKKKQEFYNPLPKYYQDIKVNGKETKDKNS